MSWSVQAVGKVPAVCVEVAKQFSQGKCIDPEESIRKAAMDVIAAAIAAQGSNVVIKVAASGSQSTDYVTNVIRNQLNIVIEPLYGFLE